ncbi:hypothetical protein FB567DRAFT_590924 [Paraphoma chrysanthemicola]|uniref:Uncharacterized protein n=1 Tax=Paraphoma chrysanthemicola TaxID=798071 RepID=A0A8K0R910_9PLEO|nr:hypothetical protein FB567DRAFT_590924 [Paraphoma chrysanthemicola]
MAGNNNNNQSSKGKGKAKAKAPKAPNPPATSSSTREVTPQGPDWDPDMYHRERREREAREKHEHEKLRLPCQIFSPLPTFLIIIIIIPVTNTPMPPYGIKVMAISIIRPFVMTQTPISMPMVINLNLQLVTIQIPITRHIVISLNHQLVKTLIHKLMNNRSWTTSAALNTMRPGGTLLPVKFVVNEQPPNQATMSHLLREPTKVAAPCPHTLHHNSNSNNNFTTSSNNNFTSNNNNNRNNRHLGPTRLILLTHTHHTIRLILVHLPCQTFSLLLKLIPANLPGKPPIPNPTHRANNLPPPTRQNTDPMQFVPYDPHAPRNYKPYAPRNPGDVEHHAHRNPSPKQTAPPRKPPANAPAQQSAAHGTPPINTAAPKKKTWNAKQQYGQVAFATSRQGARDHDTGEHIGTETWLTRNPSIPGAPTRGPPKYKRKKRPEDQAGASGPPVTKPWEGQGGSGGGATA